jgi:thiol-disulfide isomerase/thioredoxin
MEAQSSHKALKNILIVATILAMLFAGYKIIYTKDTISNTAINGSNIGDTMMFDESTQEAMPVGDTDKSEESLEGYLQVDAEAEIDTAFMPTPEPGEFVEYADGTLAYAEDGQVVLFFHAPWCPSCRGLESDIEANISAIPDGLSLQKVDYDSATELKKKYGVVRQHTLVQVDATGNMIKTLTGVSNTLSQVVSQL